MRHDNSSIVDNHAWDVGPIYFYAWGNLCASGCEHAVPAIKAWLVREPARTNWGQSQPASISKNNVWMCVCVCWFNNSCVCFRPLMLLLLYSHMKLYRNRNHFETKCCDTQFVIFLFIISMAFSRKVKHLSEIWRSAVILTYWMRQCWDSQDYDGVDHCWICEQGDRGKKSKR